MNIAALNPVLNYQYNEYLLILNPHEELRNKIIYIKNAFAEKYKSVYAKFGQPHISLVNFVQLQIAEERIVNRLKTIAIQNNRGKLLNI